jgi:hypothetical protein
VVLPLDNNDNENSCNRSFFLWTHETEELQVTIQWEKLKITDDLVLLKLR